MANSVCRICGNANENRTYTAREMMFGRLDEFDYFECGHCHCTQIAKYPDNISSFYPDDYYSYGARDENPIKKKPRNTIRKWYIHDRAGNVGIMTKLSNLIPRSLISDFFPWLTKDLKLTLDSRILDVGCGSGDLLLRLNNLGFRNLTGIDPFVQHDIHYTNGVNIYRRSLSEESGTYDFIMFHHSFEHMPDQLQTIQELHRLMQPGSFAIIRVPVSGYAWREYRENWFQLDAPRHLYIHSTDSMRLLATQAGLTFAGRIDDSTAMQFEISEAYSRGISLTEHNLNSSKRTTDGAYKKKLKEWNALSKKLNRAGDGDQACFYLYKSTESKV